MALRETGLVSELTSRSLPLEVLPDTAATVEDLVMQAIRAAVKAGGLPAGNGTVELLAIGAGVVTAVPVGTMLVLLLPSLTAVTGASSTLLAISSASSVKPPISSVNPHCVSYVMLQLS